MADSSYDYDEALKASVQYFGGDEVAARVWVDKYALKDASGLFYELTPSDMHNRLSTEFARIEAKYPDALSRQTIFSLLDHFRFLVPAGSPMAGIGNPFQLVSLSNCFVIGENSADSYGAILKLDEEQVQIMKRRGGVGLDMSPIRPKGRPVKNSAFTASGLVPFMERFSNSTREVAQYGRRGALLLTVDMKHPDAESFFKAKLDNPLLANAHVAVRINDAFMEAVLNHTSFQQQFPVDSSSPVVSAPVDAAQLWNHLMHSISQGNEAGIFFWDSVLRESVADCYASKGFRSVTANPGGESPLSPYDSSRLMALNLFSYVEHPFTKEATFNFRMFKQHVDSAMRLLDDLIDLEMETVGRILMKVAADPESNEVKRTEAELWHKIKNKTAKARRAGLGVTGEADMLAAMGLTYGSSEAAFFSERVHSSLAIEAYRSSVQMAKQRGAFEVYDPELEAANPFIVRLRTAAPDLYADMVKFGRRNMACLSMAPTDSSSLLSQTSSGIEPVSTLYFKRPVPKSSLSQGEEASSEYSLDFHPKFLEWMRVQGLDSTQSFSDEELASLVARSPYAGATASLIDPMQKVKGLGAIQKWIDQSIAAVILLPDSAPESQIADLFEAAWHNGCKGCRILRNVSNSSVLTPVFSKVRKQMLKTDEALLSAFERPHELEADVVRFQNNKEKWIAFVGLVHGLPYEIFTGLADDEEGLLVPKSIDKGVILKNRDEATGQSRYDFQYVNKRGYKTTIEGLSFKFNPEYWNYAKLISSVLRYGMPIDQVVRLISSLQLNSDTINNWKIGVARALKKYMTDEVDL